MILILAPSQDVHARRVAQEIALLGERTQILDQRSAGNGMCASLRYRGGSVERLVRQEAGAPVIDTLITSDQEEAAGFVGAHGGNVVHKAMTSPRDAFLDTRCWDERDRPALTLLPLAPTIFQEKVTGPRDIRVTMVGAEHYAAAIESGRSMAGVDSRLDLNVPVTACTLPDEVASRLTGLPIAAAAGRPAGGSAARVIRRRRDPASHPRRGRTAAPCPPSWRRALSVRLRRGR